MSLPTRRLVQVGAILIVSGIAGALGYSYLSSRLPPIPQRPLRIGFEPNPPFQIRTEGGLGGLAVEAVDEAARRAGLKLQWIETGTSSEEALEKGMVDLWPLMTDLPDRRRRFYLSEPWVISSHILLLRAGAPTPDRSFEGRIALFRIPVHLRLLRSEFPQAQAIPLGDAKDVVRMICNAGSDAGFLETRVALTALKDKPPDCALRVQSLPNLTMKNCVASVRDAAGAASALRREIGKMYREGTLKVTWAKYSSYGLDDAWATYDLMETAERTRWITWGSVALAMALFLALWQTVSARQRKETERVLRASEERFRSIFQQAGVGVAQISLDGRVQLVNDRYCEVVGYTRESLVGRGTVDITHRHDVKEEIAMLPRLLSGEIQSFSTEKRYERGDGQIVWAEMCKSLVRDGDGRPKCFIAVVEDITERKRAEAALKESEERFRNMADSAPVLIWMAREDMLCTFFNKSWLKFTGRTLEEQWGEGWTKEVHPDDMERCLATYTEAFHARREFRMEFRLRRADGEFRWVLDHGIPRFDSNDVFAGYIGSCLDVTDLRRSYEQHLATQKLESLGVLAAGVAHDFNNLLGAIVARAESAQSELESNCPATGEVEQIRVTALRAAEIVSQLMTFAGQEGAPPAGIDLSGLVSEILDLLRVSISKAAVLKTELATGLPLAHANPGEIRQVAMNLIINASESLGGQPGTITVRTASVDGAVLLEVSDTGCGMTEEVKARIFDPFFTTHFAGRGLGLSAVQGIVRRHGGSIQVESAPEEGSRFTILLPCAAVLPRSESRPEDIATHGPEPGAGILFVEDEESLRSVVAKALRKRDFRVIEAPDGELAIEILKADPGAIDLVLLDVTLPGIGGAELLAELMRIQPGLKVILSTAYSREKAMSEIGGWDIRHFIRKPYRTDDLVNALQRALRDSAARSDRSAVDPNSA